MEQKLILYNVLKGEKQEFIPINKNLIGIYTCGPTVYNYAHIGNLRTFLMEDILVRTLNYIGYKTNHIMNFTDVDDKTIKRSIAEGKKLLELTKEYEEAFLEDIDNLGLKRADQYPRATEFISQMIECTQILIDKGYAYTTEDGSVYYAINQFSEYGQLSKIHLEDLLAGASNRVELDEYGKDHISDFVLWKAYKSEDGDVFWESPWGKGRPGWHLECSVMSHAYLGSTFDIHCGGIDNKFPHHENEIAQSKAAYGGAFAKYFMHIAHLKFGNIKMSKSLGNVIYLKNIIEQGIDTKILRYALLSGHYRQELIFSDELVYQSTEALTRLWALVENLKTIDKSGDVSHETSKILTTLEEGFNTAVLDDLNIPKAMGYIFIAVREINKILEYLTREQAEEILNLFEKMDSICNFLIPKKQKQFLTLEQESLLQDRIIARKNKNFIESDRLRDILFAQGIEVKDTKDGQIYNFK